MIPEGWRQANLQDVAPVIDCKHKTPRYTAQGVPIVSPGNLAWGGLKLDGCRTISEADHAEMMDHCRVAIGDVVFGRNQSVGVSSIVTNDSPFALGQDTVLIKPRSISPGFLHQWLQSRQFELSILRLQGGSTFGRINLKDLRAVPTPVPPSEEADRIAETLQTWDRAIETVEALIANARAQKQALMQQLLTGKRRLPGFSDGARIVSLSEIAKIETGSSNKEDSLDKGKYTFFDRSTEIRRSNQYLFDTEAIIIGGEGQEFIPKHFHGKFDLHQRAYALHSFKEAECRYVFYATHHVRHLLRRYSVGSTVASLRMPTFQRVNIWLPSLPEQKAISAHLTANDDEILGLQSQLTALRQEKAALMQQLLTGKRRVKLVREEEAC